MAAMLMEIMTPDPTSCRSDARMTEVARLMRDEEIGDVLVVADDGTLVGIVTDRDLVVHGLAEGSAADAKRTFKRVVDEFPQFQVTWSYAELRTAFGQATRALAGR